MDNYWNRVIELSIEAARENEVPVGAILVRDNEIISYGYNKREQKNSVLAHAEIECIEKASKKLNSWKLNDCDIYVSLKPCSMCEEVIRQSRIRNVYYLLDKPDNKKEYYKTNVCKSVEAEYKEKYREILTNFFNKLR